MRRTPAWYASEAIAAGHINEAALRSVTPLVDASTVTVRLAPRWMKLWWPTGVIATTWPMFGVFVDKPTFHRDRAELAPLMVHELIHVQQWRHTGGVRMSMRYLNDYVRGRLRGKTHWAAYRDVRYEVAARRLTSTVVAQSQA